MFFNKVAQNEVLNTITGNGHQIHRIYKFRESETHSFEEHKTVCISVKEINHCEYASWLELNNKKKLLTTSYRDSYFIRLFEVIILRKFS